MTIRSIAEQLRHLPKNAGSRATVGRWFSGESTPGELELAALANIFRVPAALLRSLAQLAPREGGNAACSSPTSLWTEMIRGHQGCIAVGGPLMAIASSRIARSVKLADTTIVALLPSPTNLIATAQPDRHGACANAATWLAAGDGLVELSGRLDGVRVRLWIRDDHDRPSPIDESQFLANDLLMFEFCTACHDGFRLRVSGEPDWEPVAALIADLRCNKAIPGARLAYDSAWPPCSSRTRDFIRLRERVVRSLHRMPIPYLPHD